MTRPLITLENITKRYSVGKETLHAIRGITLSLQKGERLGLAGESGCGKSTLARLAALLEIPNSGNIIWEGQDVTSFDRQRTIAVRKKIQLVFQNPFNALNPRMRIGDSLMEGLDLNPLKNPQPRQLSLKELLDLVELPLELAKRYPHELSGGQCQRVTLARALAIKPGLLIADEPMAALDLSSQIRLTALLKRLYSNSEASLLIISHDLQLLKQLCHRIAILYLGEVVELATPEELFARPKHPYTQALLHAVPKPDPDYYRGKRGIPLLRSEIPSPLAPPSGCAFHPRCPFVQPICAKEAPSWKEEGVRCHFPQVLVKEDSY